MNYNEWLYSYTKLTGKLGKKSPLSTEEIDELLEIIETAGLASLLPRRAQGRQKHSRQQRYDRNHHKQFNQRKRPSSFSAEFRVPHVVRLHDVPFPYIPEHSIFFHDPVRVSFFPSKRDS